MKYLLDTNIISDFRRGISEDLNRWVSTRTVGEAALSAITVFELEQGALRIERRDPRSGAHLREWVERTVTVEFAERVLPLDDRVAREAARLHVPDPMPEMDAFLAATALVHNLTLVTRNVRDFERTQVRLLNPWDA